MIASHQLKYFSLSNATLQGRASPGCPTSIQLFAVTRLMFIPYWRETQSLSLPYTLSNDRWCRSLWNRWFVGTQHIFGNKRLNKAMWHCLATGSWDKTKRTLQKTQLLQWGNEMRWWMILPFAKARCFQSHPQVTFCALKRKQRRPPHRHFLNSMRPCTRGKMAGPQKKRKHIERTH